MPSRSSLRPAAFAVVAVVAAGLAFAGRPVAAAGLSEKILEDRYGRGDYGLALGWYDPWDWQFDEHGSAGWPFAVKAGLKLSRFARVELDFSYFRTSGVPDGTISLYTVPHFDGLWISTAILAPLGDYGRFRPYVGGGPMFVSLTNEFLVIRLDVAEPYPDRPEQRAIARWSRFDTGGFVVAGIDLPIGRRAFPFVEYRHLFGRLSVEPKDVKLNGQSLELLNLEVEELTTIPPNAVPGVVGRRYASDFDWSGPVVTVGLKIRF